jgi:hypothetical protein
MKPEETVMQKSITRTEIAQWYGITERALRNRMKNVNLHITNRILTRDDIRLILRVLKEPQFMPIDLYNFYFAT